MVLSLSLSLSVSLSLSRRALSSLPNGIGFIINTKCAESDEDPSEREERRGEMLPPDEMR